MRRFLGMVTLFFITTALCAQERPTHLDVSAASVFANGKWKSTSGKPGDEPAFKHVVEIHCFKPQRTCMEAQANVVAGEPDIQYYKVLQWGQNGLVAENGSPICMTNQLIINFQKNSVIAVDAPKRGAKGFKGSCKVLDHTQTYQLVGKF